MASDVVAAFPTLLKEDDCVSTSMGANGEDVRMSPAAREVIPLSIECKNVERLNIWSAIDQCRANAPEGTHPCVVFTRNRSDTYAVVPWPVLLQLYKSIRSKTRGRWLSQSAIDVLREILSVLESAELPHGSEEGDDGETVVPPSP